jgi:acetyl esterase/lipase
MELTKLPGEGEIVRLWQGQAPLAQGNQDADIPTLTFYPPKNPNGAAIICCPGGGYNHLAWEKEGAIPARWLADLGILGIALKYRVDPYRHPAPLLDFKRALRLVRANAGNWNIDPQKIGILGFSAGGHHAASLATSFDPGDADAVDAVDRVSCRPDVCVLLYAGVSTKLQSQLVKHNTRFLLGPDYTEAQLRETSCENFVTADTPPTFFFMTVDDGSVTVENALNYGSAMKRAGVPFEMHLFEHGRHGVGLAPADPILGVWPKLCETWLGTRGYTAAG